MSGNLYFCRRVAGVVMIISAISVNTHHVSAASGFTGDEVTICHRTGSTSMPYRKLTVDPHSILNLKGHLSHTDGNGPFDPNFNYPSNAKDWEDIIPPFDYEYNGVPGHFSGMNYEGRGLEIYNNECAAHSNVMDDDSTTTINPAETSTSTTTTTLAPLPRKGVRVTVYIDLNGNCQLDDDEPLIPEVVVQVSNATKLFTGITGSTGSFIESPVGDGTYTGVVMVKPEHLSVECTNEDTTDLEGKEIADIFIGLRGNLGITIIIDPPEGLPEPEKIVIDGCGPDEVCGTDDDFFFPVFPAIDETFPIDNIPPGDYFITPVRRDGVEYETKEIHLDTDGAQVEIKAEVSEASTVAELARTGIDAASARAIFTAILLLAGAGLVLVRRRHAL